MARSYGYTVARLKALENRLLDEAFFNRLADSPSLESAVKTLGETSYGTAMMDLKNPTDFDSAIDGELSRCYRELLTFVPDADLVALARLIYDMHNAKTVLKGRFAASQGGSRRLDLLSALANLDTDALTLALEGDDYARLPYGLGDGLREAFAHLESGGDLRAFEQAVDRNYYKTLVTLASGLDVPLVTRWVKARIDGDNLKTLLRLSRLGFEAGDLKGFLIEGGDLDFSRLKALYAEPVENWSRALGTTDWAPLFASFAEGGEFSRNLARFEKELDDFITALLSPCRYEAFSPANVTRYLWAKEMEAKNLRLTLVSLANGVNREQIRGLLRHVG